MSQHSHLDFYPFFSYTISSLWDWSLRHTAVIFYTRNRYLVAPQPGKPLPYLDKKSIGGLLSQEVDGSDPRPDPTRGERGGGYHDWVTRSGVACGVVRINLFSSNSLRAGLFWGGGEDIAVLFSFRSFNSFSKNSFFNWLLILVSTSFYITLFRKPKDSIVWICQIHFIIYLVWRCWHKKANCHYISIFCSGCYWLDYIVSLSSLFSWRKERWARSSSRL